MSDLLERGAVWLADQRTRHLSQTVTYLRGSDSVEVPATLGRTTSEQTDDYGVVHPIQAHDFLILAADLVLAGAVTTPRAGDRIRDGRGVVYAVLAVGDEPPFRYADAYRQTLRIHTKEVEAGP